MLNPLPAQALITNPAHTVVAVEIGSLRLALTRASSNAAMAPAPLARPFLTGAVAGVGALALLVVGASAAPRPVEPLRYSVVVRVPDSAPRQITRPTRAITPGRPIKRIAADPAPATSAERFGPADEPFVTRAMATGALQEWEDDLGRRRFLTAGAARIEGGRTCRDLALLVRMAEGGSHVRSATRCTTDPIDVPTPSASADE